MAKGKQWLGNIPVVRNPLVNRDRMPIVGEVISIAEAQGTEVRYLVQQDSDGYSWSPKPFLKSFIKKEDVLYFLQSLVEGLHKKEKDLDPLDALKEVYVFEYTPNLEAIKHSSHRWLLRHLTDWEI